MAMRGSSVSRDRHVRAGQPARLGSTTESGSVDSGSARVSQPIEPRTGGMTSRFQSYVVWVLRKMFGRLWRYNVFPREYARSGCIEKFFLEHGFHCRQDVLLQQTVLTEFPVDAVALREGV